MKSDRALASLAGVGIVLVVLGHSGPMPASMPSVLAHSEFARFFFGPVHDWIYSFHMPLFFFMAGFSYIRYSSAYRSRFTSLLQSKGTKLLLPYIVLTTLWFPLKALASAHAQRPVSFTWTEYATQIIIPWKNVIIFYWFLPTLFLMFVLNSLLLRWTTKQRLALPLVALGATVTYFAFGNENDTGWQSILNLGGVFHNYVFFCLGSLVGRYRIEPWITRWGAALTPISVAIFASCPASVRNLGGFVLVMALMNICGLWALVHRYQITILGMIGDHAFAIYLWSCAPQIALSILFDAIFHTPVVITTAVTFIAGLVGPLLFVQRIRPCSNRIVRDALGLTGEPQRSVA
jgi:fucose 4-O-acetylase-like acetyltransferase